MTKNSNSKGKKKIKNKGRKGSENNKVEKNFFVKFYVIKIKKNKICLFFLAFFRLFICCGDNGRTEYWRCNKLNWSLLSLICNRHQRIVTSVRWNVNSDSNSFFFFFPLQNCCWYLKHSVILVNYRGKCIVYRQKLPICEVVSSFFFFFFFA